MEVKTAATVGVACAFGGLAASAALGQISVPTPTISAPTVSVPTVTVPNPAPPVPVPTVPVPRVPTPTVPVPAPPRPPVPTPAVPTPTVRTPTVALPVTTRSVQVTPSGQLTGGSPSVGGGVSGPATTGGGYSASARTQAPAAASSAHGVPRGRATRSWIAVRGADKRRTATLVFRLGRRGAVDITVVEVSPVCRIAARFRVGGHAGTNRVTVGRGAHGTRLMPGTYRIVGRTRGGRTVLRQTIVVVQARAPSPAELAFARRSNVCGATGLPGAGSTNAALASASFSVPAGPSQSTIRRHQRTSDQQDGADAHGRPVAAGISDAVKGAATDPIVIALLVLAALVFGVAALPRTVLADPRTMAAVAMHRAEFAVVGAAVLAVAVVAILLR